MRTTIAGLLLCAALLGSCAGDPGPGPDAFTDAPRLELDNFVVLESGLAAGGQPSEAALRRAAELGYRTVVNLRASGETPTPEDERRIVEGLGLRYVHVPIEGAAVTREHAREFSEAVRRSSDRPVLVHCSTGNRAAGVWAIHLVDREGVPVEEALRRAEAAGMRANVRASVERELR